MHTSLLRDQPILPIAHEQGLNDTDAVALMRRLVDATACS